MHKSILWSLTFVFTEIRAKIHLILRRQLKWLHNSRHAQRWEKSGECFDFIATFLWQKNVSIMCLSDCVMKMLDWWNHELWQQFPFCFMSCRLRRTSLLPLLAQESVQHDFFFQDWHVHETSMSHVLFMAVLLVLCMKRNVIMWLLMFVVWPCAGQMCKTFSGMQWTMLDSHDSNGWSSCLLL